MNDSSRHGANLATSGNPMAATIASSANRPGGLPLVLRYVLVMLVSALLHAGAWQLRHLLYLHPETLPKPKPPIEVTLVAVPKPVAEAAAPAAGAITRS